MQLRTVYKNQISYIFEKKCDISVNFVEKLYKNTVFNLWHIDLYCLLNLKMETYSSIKTYKKKTEWNIIREAPLLSLTPRSPASAR